MDTFCGSEFWDWNYTWYTDSPHLTSCFEETVLVWTPCLYFLVTFFVGYYQCRRSIYREIPWGWLNISKLVGVGILFLLTFLDTLFATYLRPSDMKMYPVDYTTGIFKYLAFALVATLIVLFRKYGIRTSAITLTFWLLLVTFSVPHYVSQIKSVTDPEADVRMYPYISNVIYFPTILAMLLLELFVDARPVMSFYPTPNPPPITADISFLNSFFALWFDKFAFRHYRTTKLRTEDLPGLTYHERLEYLVPLFNKYWKEQEVKKITSQSSSKKKNTFSDGSHDMDNRLRSSNDVSVFSVIWSCVSGTFFISTFFKIFSHILTFVSPQILRLLINHLQSDEPAWRGYFYAIALTLSSLLQSLMINTYTYSISRVGVKVRSVLMSMVFRKVLRISNGTKREFTAGEITNLMSIDSQRFVDVFYNLNMAVSSPVIVFVTLYFLWDLLGISTLAGLIVLLIIVPFNWWAGSKMKKLQNLQMKCKDERVKITNEVLSGIKVLKMYAWEPNFGKRIMEIREREIKLLRRIAFLDTLNSATWMTSPILVSLAMFAAFTFVDEKNQLTTEIALVSLSLFNVMKLPLSLIPRFVSNLAQTVVASKRITEFLNAEELDFGTVSHNETEDSQISIDQGTFSWEENDPPILKNINLKIVKGSLVAIVGPVGSGKSSLLSAILGEMYKIEGQVNTHGSIAYVPQQAWIQNAVLRDNVLFTSPYQATKYNTVIDSCALHPDLQVLPKGDLTEIGEKGINLSGGQKQRVSLARAVYNDAEVYLLDDPMSAVDAHVGKHIFQKVIGPHGLLRKKTRLLVTNAITYLPEMDFIVVMKGGVVVESGTYDQLMSNKGEFADLRKNFSLDEEIEEETNESSSVNLTRDQRLISEEDVSVLSSFPDEPTTDDFFSESMVEKLIEKEQTKDGGVKSEVYWYYFKAGGILLWVGVLSFNLLYQILSTLANLWLTYWSNDPAIATKRYYYLGGYTEYAIGIVLSVGLASFSLNFAVLNASSYLHENLLNKVMYWRAYIFDITPLGQILNRFSYDVDVADNTLGPIIKQLANLFGMVLSTLGVIVYSNPIFILALIPLVILYSFIQQLYIGLTRQLKRLESASRSPVYSYFSETITGAPVIRAYRAVEQFIKESDERMLGYQVCAYTSQWAFKWICFRLDGLANLIILMVSLLAVVYRGAQNSGVLSLSVTYALQLTRALTLVIRSTSDIESSVVSIERIQDFENTPVEKRDSPKYRSIPPSWPTEGVIVFQGYKARYREELDFVLRDLNFRIESGEKVGVVGRTGAGKSSLSLSLFRIFEPVEGTIIIDGIDITEIELSVLRSRITIIPQDPVLFSGTVRLNLDPFFEYNDQQLWQTLELAHLKSFISSLPEGLEYEIAENGGNLSVGQRQLICLARALLRKTKILVLDEATAAIDLETDELIQKTIRKEFSECTVVTIAHKLNTVMDSDRIMVLDKGLVKEFDSPARLLEAKNSIFYGLAKEAGLVL